MIDQVCPARFLLPGEQGSSHSFLLSGTILQGKEKCQESRSSRKRNPERAATASVAHTHTHTPPPMHTCTHICTHTLTYICAPAHAHKHTLEGAKDSRDSHKTSKMVIYRDKPEIEWRGCCQSRFLALYLIV